ncbi:MAG: ATP-binding protein, partial [Candidatus Thorarchaeota archaeon]
LKRDFSIKEMIKCIESSPTITELYKPATKTALIQRLKRADRLGVFNPGGTSAQDLAVAGQITIIDVAPLGSDAESVLAILTNMLCRQVLTYRMAWTDEGTSAREELPPTWLIIDEAHTLVPRAGHTPAKDAIIGYAKLGRRFGCSLVLCTQQPSAVSDDAISQADIILSHSLSHDSDIKALQQRAPAVMPEQFRDKVFISSLPRGVALAFDQNTENKRGFIMQVRPRLSQHGGTDRLSGLFEAVRLLIPEDVEEESEEEEIEEEPDVEEELVEEIPEVPRPPLKLSKEDWKVLDGWLKEYIEELFNQQKQEYDIIDEPAPRVEEPPPSPMSTEMEWELERVPITELDVDQIRVRRFSPLTKLLLGKAMTRQVLYSRASHEFLFTSETDIRETLLVEREGDDPTEAIEDVTSGLLSAGMNLDELLHEGEFTFVCFRKDGMRAAFTVGISESNISVPIVVIGTHRKSVGELADKIRSVLPT